MPTIEKDHASTDICLIGAVLASPIESRRLNLEIILGDRDRRSIRDGAIRCSVESYGDLIRLKYERMTYFRVGALNHVVRRVATIDGNGRVASDRVSGNQLPKGLRQEPMSRKLHPELQIPDVDSIIRIILNRLMAESGER